MPLMTHNGKAMYVVLLYVSRPLAGQPIQGKVHYIFSSHSLATSRHPHRYFQAEVFVKPSRELVSFVVFLLRFDGLIRVN